MSTNREGHSAISARSRGARCLGLLVAAVLACGSWSSAQSSAEFHKTLALNQSQPLLLTIEIASANLEVVYGRDGEVSISAVATSSSNSSVDDQFFTKSLTLEQDGNRVSLRAALSPADSGMNIRYRLDVPYRTEVSSRLTHGTQLITGMLGPVNATAGKGDIKVSYVSKGVRALAETGDIDFQVIGERGEARTGAGNISCSRAVEGINAGTGEGDITLMVVGPSIAIIGKGTGRIDIGGARGSLTATTAGGDIHVKANPHEDWKISSTSGAIRVELPSSVELDLDASTDTGELEVDRADMARLAPDARHVHGAVNGGGKRVEIHTGSGRIVIR